MRYPTHSLRLIVAALLLAGLPLAQEATSAEPEEPTIATIAGSGKPSSPETAKAAPPLEFAMDNPFGMESFARDLFICEYGGHRILKFDRKADRVEVFAGTGEKKFSGDGGPALQATFNQPHELCVDQNSGDFYVADTFNHAVRKINAYTGATSTIAGTGEAGYSGDGGPAAQAKLNQPISVAFDYRGGLLVADIGNHRIRRIDLGQDTGEITIDTIAGTGEKKLQQENEVAKGTPALGPRALYVDRASEKRTLYVAFREGNSVWSVDLEGDGTWKRIAGTGKKGYSGDGGDPLEATFNGPKGIIVDSASGKIYVADTENHAIRVIDRKANRIETLAGKGPSAGTFGGDGGPASEASLKRPHGVHLTPLGELLIGDSENHRVRQIELP